MKRPQKKTDSLSGPNDRLGTNKPLNIMERGKLICNTLKEVRRQIAQANHITYEPTECKHKGDCMGTCPKCEQEMRYIEKQLSIRKAMGKAVSVVGISIGIAALSSCGKIINIFGNNENGYLIDGDMPNNRNVPADSTGQNNSKKGKSDANDGKKEPKSMVVKTDTIKEDIIFGDIMEIQPSFVGGEQKLKEYLSKEVVYPEEAKKDSIEGRVVIQFVIDKDGSISDAKVAKSLHPLFDNEALRVVKAMPKWIPGKIGGKPMKTKYMLPIKFKLPQ